jgi:hypothetical protein
MYHTAAYFEGKEKNKEMIMNKLQNVAGLRDRRSEKKRQF